MKAERWEKFGLALILAAQLAALICELPRTGVTADEPSHMVSAYMYWRGEDVLKPGDMPPFIKILGGWPALLLKPPLPVNEPVWKTQHEWNIAADLFNRMKRPGELGRYVTWSRVPFLMVLPAVTLLLWFWARRLFSPATALWVTALWALEPTALGHGVLFKNDVAATLGYVWFWLAAWLYWRAPRWKSALHLATALAFACLTKMSMLVLLAAGPLILLGGALLKRKWVLAAAGVPVMALIVWVATAAACQFETRRLTPGEIFRLRLAPGISEAMGRITFPARYLDGGFSLLAENERHTGVYLFGQMRPGGDRRYFLAALGLKEPLMLLLLATAGLAIALVSKTHRPKDGALAWLAAAPALYIGLASLSSLQLGVRLVLPGVPFLVLMAGPAFEWFQSKGWRWAPATAMALVAASVAPQYPNLIAYFNELAPTIEQRMWALSDSNIDWGQGLPELGAYCKENGVRQLKLSYFGNDLPFRYLENGEYEMVAPPWGPQWARGERLEPESGVWAVSATLLPGHFFSEKYRDYYAEFRSRRPDVVLGGSILVYRVP